MLQQPCPAAVWTRCGPVPVVSLQCTSLCLCYTLCPNPSSHIFKFLPTVPAPLHRRHVYLLLLICQAQPFCCHCLHTPVHLHPAATDMASMAHAPCLLIVVIIEDFFLVCGTATCTKEDWESSGMVALSTLSQIHARPGPNLSVSWTPLPQHSE